MKRDNLTTPKSLRAAILRGMCIGPIAEAPEAIEAEVRNFCAHKFGVLQTDKMRKLWNEIFNEGSAGETQD